MSQIDRNRPAILEELEALDDDDWYNVITASEPESEDTDWGIYGYHGNSEKITAHMNMLAAHIRYLSVMLDEVDTIDEVVAHAEEAARLHAQDTMWEPNRG